MLNFNYLKINLKFIMNLQCLVNKRDIKMVPLPPSPHTKSCLHHHYTNVVFSEVLGGKNCARYTVHPNKKENFFGDRYVNKIRLE